MTSSASRASNKKMKITFATILEYEGRDWISLSVYETRLKSPREGRSASVSESESYLSIFIRECTNTYEVL
jgi:hypothetical protein